MPIRNAASRQVFSQSLQWQGVSSAQHSGTTLNTLEQLLSRAALHLLHRHTPVAGAGDAAEQGGRSFHVGTTARINHTALFFSRGGCCFFVVLVTSVEVIRLQQIRQCFDDLIKMQSGSCAQNWDS